jgi:hypothetical protein
MDAPHETLNATACTTIHSLHHWWVLPLGGLQRFALRCGEKNGMHTVQVVLPSHGADSLRVGEVRRTWAAENRSMASSTWRRSGPDGYGQHGSAKTCPGWRGRRTRALCVRAGDFGNPGGPWAKLSRGGLGPD